MRSRLRKHHGRGCASLARQLAAATEDATFLWATTGFAVVATTRIASLYLASNRRGTEDGLVWQYETCAVGVGQLRLHEIAESDNVIINPITSDQLDLLGRICRLRPGQRQLDLACGKGEMLCRWARDHGISGVGVDLSSVFIAAARQRANELGVSDRVELVQGDAAAYSAPPRHFDVVSCIGATWIGNGLVGTLELMRPGLKDDGLMLVGEPFWNEEPPGEAFAAFETAPGEFVSLAGTAHRFAQAGFDLVEMVLANLDGWDRYVAPHWWAIDTWLREHPDHPDSAALRAFAAAERAGYLAYGRRYLGWGVFVLRPVC